MGFSMTFSNAINWLRRDGPRWENLGITYSGGTFSVTQADSSSLSSVSPGFITVPDRANPGRQRVFKVSANQSFTDSAGSNQIGNSLFGFTTAIAFAQDVPFFIYFAADNSDATGTFFISRVPHRSVCPVAGNIGQSGDTNASTQGSFFALQAVTAANFAGQPCVCIGAFRMQYTGSSWTVQTLSDGSSSSSTNKQADGIGCFHSGSKFSVATGQFGAASGSFFTNNGGTAPAWSSQSFSYSIHQNGDCRFSISGATSSAGSGAVTATIALPIKTIDTAGIPGTFNYTNGLGNYNLNATNNTLIHTAITSTPAFTTLTNANLAVSGYQGNFRFLAEST
jgi:hypothetical protein